MVVGKVTEAKSQDEKVCGVDGLGAGDVFLGIGIDESTFAELISDFEAVMSMMVIRKRPSIYQSPQTGVWDWR